MVIFLLRNSWHSKIKLEIKNAISRHLHLLLTTKQKRSGKISKVIHKKITFNRSAIHLEFPLIRITRKTMFSIIKIYGAHPLNSLTKITVLLQKRKASLLLMLSQISEILVPLIASLPRKSNK